MKEFPFLKNRLNKVYKKKGGDEVTETLNAAEKKHFYKQMLAIGLPVMLQQLIVVGLNLADTIMVGKISENALAAVGAANQVYFVYSVLIFGIFSGAGVYLVQYWGIRDLKSLRKILGIDYVVCVAVTVPVILLAYFASPVLVGLFTEDSEVISLGSDYMKIACFSYIFSALTFVISYNSRATAILKIPTIVNGCAISLNIFLNYCLIYGKLGMPELGVRGAAIATLVARIAECAAMFIYVYASKDNPLKATLKELGAFTRELFAGVMKTAVPVIINEAMWALSVAIIFAIYGYIGPTALAIVQVANTVTDVFQTAYAGLGNASAVIVGQTLGQGKKELAYRYSSMVLKVTWALNIVMTLILIAIRGIVADIYDFNPHTTRLLMEALLVYAVAITPKMLAYLIICGILRAGGDTMYCMLIDVGFNVLLQIPLAFIAVKVLQLSLPFAIAVVAISDFAKVILCYQRYFSKKWVNVFTGM